MKIVFFEPLGSAWHRMKTALFKPFDLNKWLLVAFTAFLAGLADWNGNFGNNTWDSGGSFRDFLDFPGKAWGWLTSHPGWFTLILFGVAFLFVLGIVLLWLSSRGKFMFLHNVAHNKAEVSGPWKEFKKEGDSLFLWRLIFVFLCFVVFFSLIAIMFAGANQLYKEASFRSTPVFFLIMMGFLFFIMMILTGYISAFLNSFVVPIMFKHRISATKSWKKFLSLFGKFPFHFILYGLLLFVLTVLFVILLVLAGLFTCCIGFLLLMIPYIGTLITLPVLYWYRAFSLEFLAQFGEEYNVLPPKRAEPARSLTKA